MGEDGGLQWYVVIMERQVVRQFTYVVYSTVIETRCNLGSSRFLEVYLIRAQSDLPAAARAAPDPAVVAGVADAVCEFGLKADVAGGS